MTTCWIDPADTKALARVVLSAEEYATCGDTVPVLSQEQEEFATSAIAVAAETLGRLTGNLVHGAGVAVDECTAYPELSRLSPLWKPLRSVISVQRLTIDDVFEDYPEPWRVSAGAIVFGSTRSHGRLVGPTRLYSGGRREIVRVQYRFGSTVTLAAREECLYFARQIYLAGPYGDLELCQLPARVTSVTREGLSYQLLDPQNYLKDGLTGISRIDGWIASVNRARGIRPAAIYTPDAPPMINIAMWCNDTTPLASVSVESLKDTWQ